MKTTTTFTRQNKRRILAGSIAAACAVALLGNPAARAAAVAWDITPGTVGVGDGAITDGAGTWNTTNGNWTTDAGANNIAFTAADTVTFGGGASGTAGTISLGTNITATGLTFSTAFLGTYTIAPTGAETLTIGTAGIAANDSAAITANVIMGGAESWTAATTKTLTVSGTVTNGGNLLTVNGAGTVTVSGNVSGAGGITMNNASGQLNLSGSNTYSGATTVTAGTLSLSGLLGGAGNITVASGATLTESATGTIGINTGNTLSVTGTATLSGSNTYTGATTVNTGGVLNIRNAIALGTTGAGTTVSSGGALQIQGNISTLAEALTLNGTGISSDGALRNMSGVNVWNGAVTLASASRINSDAGRLILNGGAGTNSTFLLTVGGTGDVAINSSIGTGAGGLTKDGSGTLALFAANAYTGNSTLAAGTVLLGTAETAGTSGPLGKQTAAAAGTILFTGGTLQYSPQNANDYSGRFSAGGSQTIKIDTNSRDVTFATALAGAGTSLTKSGFGKLTLSAAPTYTGGTTVNNGTLLLSGAFNMPGTGALAVNGGGTFSLADGTARNTTAASLTLGTGATLVFDWNAGALDNLTSTTATAAGIIGIQLNNTSPTGAGAALLNSGGGLTSGGALYFLANNTNYTATLAPSDIAVSIGAQTPGTALVNNAFWYGNTLAGANTAGVDNAMALSNGTVSNWSTTSGSYTATGLVPGSAANVVFSGTGATQQSNIVLGADMTVNSVTFGDATPVTLGAGNAVTLLSTGTGASSAISTNENATINAGVILGASQTWTTAATKTLTIGGTIGNVTGGAGLTIAGTGTVQINGTAAYQGTTTVNNGATLTFAAGSKKTYMGANSLLPVNGVLNVAGDVDIEYFSGGGMNGVVNVSSGGSLVVRNASGGDDQHFGIGNGGYGMLNITGGVVTSLGGNAAGTGSMNLLNGGSQGLLRITGGTLNTGQIMTARNGGGSSEITITGGTLNKSTSGTFNLGDRNSFSTVLNVAGGLIDNTASTLAWGRGGGAAGASFIVMNFDAGTILTKEQAISGQGNFRIIANYNGGTVKLSPGVNANFYNGTLAATSTFQSYVNGAFASYAGGIVMDTNGSNTALNSNMLAPTGSGVTSLSLATGGSGYTGAPIVTITDSGYVASTGTVTSGSNAVTGIGATDFAKMFIGQAISGTGIPTGSIITAIVGTNSVTISQNATVSGLPALTVRGLGATAYADVSGGAVSAVTVTNPGVGYVGTVTAALGGGFGTGGSGTSATFNAITPAATSSGGLIKNGAGTLTLSGTNTFTGALAVNAGTLAFGQGSGIIDTYAAISGVGSLSQTGAGITNLSGTNTYTGGATVTAGVLTFLNTNAKPSVGVTTVNASTTLGLGVGGAGFFGSADVDALFAGTMTNVSNNATSNVGIDTTAGNFTYGTNVTSTRGLTKLGANTLILSGTNNYSGATTILGGVLNVTGTLTGTAITVSSIPANTVSNFFANFGSLTLSGSGALASNTNLTLSGGFVDLGGLTTNVGAVSIPTASLLGGNTIANGSLTGTSYAASNTSGNATIGANLLVSGGAGFAMSGNGGAVTLTGANTYTGTTNITNGAVLISGSGTLGNAAALTLGGGMVDLAGTTQTVGAVSVSAVSGTHFNTIQTGTLTSTSYAFSNTSGNAIIAANLLGAAAVTKTNAGLVALNGTNTYTGTTTLTGGTIRISGTETAGTSGPLGNPTVPAGSIIFNGGTLQFSAGNTFDYSSRFTTSGNNAYSIDTNNQSVTLASALAASGTSGLTKINVGTLTLTGGNGFTGATAVNAGILNIQNDTALGTIVAGTTVSSGAALQLQHGTGITVGGETLSLTASGLANDGALRNISGANVWQGTVTLAGATRINSDAGSLTFNTAANSITGAQALTLGGVAGGTVSGTVTTTSVAKDGTGTWTLNGANTYAGATTVFAGTLAFAGTAASTGAGGLVANGGTLLIDYTNMASPTNLLPSQAVTMNGGTVLIRGNTTNATSQTLGNVTVSNGSGQILVDPNNGTTTALILGTITSTSVGSSLLVGAPVGAGTGAGTITTTTNKDATGVYGGRVVFGNGTANTGYDFATTASGGSPFTLSAYSGYSALALAAGTDTDNSRIQANGGAATTLTGGRTTNSLKIEVPAAGDSLALGTNQLVVNNGGLLVTGTNAFTISGTTGATRLTAGNTSGAYDLVIHQYNSGGLTISAPIGNNGANATALTYAGPGALTLTGASTITGAAYVNGASFTINSGGTLSNAAGFVGNYGPSSAGLSVSATVTGTGSKWTNTAALTVGNFGSGDSLSVTTGGNVTAAGLTLGVNAGANNNSVTVGGATVGSNATFTNTGSLTVGTGGSANSLLIQKGSTMSVSGNAFVGAGAGARNSVTVDGVGSNLSIGGQATVGLGSGYGSSFTVSGGATASVGGSWWIAGGSGNPNNGQSGNTLTVTGAGSSMFFSQTGDLGDRGVNNSINVLNGGTLTTQSVYIGFFSGANYNPILVDGTNTVWNVGGINSGSSGQFNAITVSNGGRINNTGAVSMGAGNNPLNILSGATVATNNTWGLGAITNALNINGGTLLATANNVTLVTGGYINLSGTGTIDTNTFNSTISSPITGSGNLTKTKPGILTLSGLLTHTGGTTINTGAVLLSGNLNLPTTGAVTVNTSGSLSIADGTARATTANGGLTLNNGSNLTFDLGNNLADRITSTAALTSTAGFNVGVSINYLLGAAATTAQTLLSMPSGVNTPNYFIANNTNYTATLSSSATTLQITGFTPGVPVLTSAYWTGNILTGINTAGQDNAMAFSTATGSPVSNWSSTDPGSYTATGVVPGSASNVFFNVGETQQSGIVLGNSMTLNSLTFNDTTPVTIASDGNFVTLNSTGTGSLSAISANEDATINARVFLGANQTWTVGSGKTLAVGGVVAGANSLTIAGSGTTILSAANTYTGATAVNGGTLSLTGSLTGSNITVGGSGIFSESSTGIIAGTGTTFTQNSVNTSVLAGTNAYTGATAITNGVLAGIGANAFGSTSGISLSGAGTLSLRGDVSTSFVKASDSSSYAVSTTAGGATINVDQATVSVVAKTMTIGTLGSSSTAAGYAITFTGANNTSLSMGAVTGNASTAVATPTYTNNIAGTGTLTLASYTSGNTSGGETVTFGGTGNTIITGAITPSSTALTLKKAGAGSLTLQGVGTFTNGTTISAGTIYVNNSNALGSGGSSGVLVGNGASLIADAPQLLTNAAAINIANAINLGGAIGNNAAAYAIGGNVNASTTFSGAITVSRDSSILQVATTGANALNLTGGVSAAAVRTLTFAGPGAINVSTNGMNDGAGNLSVTVSGGVTTLNVANGYTGVTTVSGGILRLESANALPGGVATAGGTSNLTFNGGIIGLGSGNSSFTRSLNTAATDVTFAGAGGFAAYGTDATVNFGGGGTVDWGTASTGLNGQTLILGAASADKTVTVSNALTLGASVRTLQVDNGTATTDAILTGAISGTATTGGLTKTGAGTVNLDNAVQGYDILNANGGTTNVNGVLGTAPGQSVVAVAGTGTKLKFGSVSQTLSSLTIGAGSTVVFTSGAASGSLTGGDGGKASGFGSTTTPSLSGGSAVVPEPGTLGLLLVGALGLLNRRRRA